MPEEIEVYEPGQELPAPANHQLLVRADTPAEFVEKAGEIAKALTDVVEDRKLYSTISGRKHVLVEGWTFLGSMMGAFGNPVYAVCEWTRPIEEDGKIVGWEARVEARTLDGAVVGAAESMCTRRESTWRTRGDYAIRSMAQTRATSKALRQPLGFLMQLAGYDPTPKEEIDEPERAVQKPASVSEVSELRGVLQDAQAIDPKVWSIESVVASASRFFSRPVTSLEELTSDEVAHIRRGAEAWLVEHAPPTVVGEEDIPFGE